MSPACPLPASVGTFTWVNIDLVSLSTSFCSFPLQGATSGRGKGSCVGSGESDGRAGLSRLNSAKTELFRGLTPPGLQAGSRRWHTSDMDLGSGTTAGPPDLQEVSPNPPTLNGCAAHSHGHAMPCTVGSRLRVSAWAEWGPTTFSHGPLNRMGFPVRKKHSETSATCPSPRVSSQASCPSGPEGTGAGRIPVQ